MLFEVGETIVHPHQHAAKVTEVKTCTMDGEEKASTMLDEVLAS